MSLQDRDWMSANMERLYQLSEDSHNAFTPFKVADKIANQVADKGYEFILVINNLEFVYSLINAGVDISSINYATVCEYKAKFAEVRLGIDPENILLYDYDYLDEDFEGMKFDCVITNPPYEKNKWDEFIRLAIKLTRKGGIVAAITPRWSVLSGKRNLRRFIFNNVDVKEINHLDLRAFETLKGDKRKHILTPTHWFLGEVGSSSEEVKISRDWNDSLYHLDVKVSDSNKIVPSYLGEMGADLISMMDKLPRSDSVREKIRSRPGVPAVHSTTRHKAGLWGWERNLHTKVFMGLKVDSDGDDGNLLRGESSSSAVYYCKSAEHARNMAIWLDSMSMKLLMSQVDGGSNVLNSTLAMIPDCPITDRDATIDEMYQAAGFSSELIEWIKGFEND